MNYRNVNGGEMRVLEAFHISKSLYEPIADVGPSQGSLNGLQKKGKVCYVECLVTWLRVEESYSTYPEISQ